MSESFVSQLRTSREVIALGGASDQVLHLRAQVLEAWDAVRIDANPSATVRELKLAALRDLYPQGRADDFVVKVRGFEVMDESQSLAAAGAVQGTLFLIADRLRRPVQ